MRVAYICADSGVPVFGSKGCSVHVQEIIRQFLRRHDHVKLYTVRTGGENCLDGDRFDVQEFCAPKVDSLASRELLQINLASHIASHLAHSEAELVYERYSLWSCEALCEAQRLDIPSILEVNAPLIDEQLQHRQLIHSTEAGHIRDRAFRAATTIIAVSAAVADYVKQNLPEDQQAKVHVVPNGVDTERFRPDVQPITEREAFTVGFLGTLKPWHGLESLLAAFRLLHAQAPEVVLRVIGDGPLREPLGKHVQEQMPGLYQHIEWVGAVSPQHVPGHLTTLDVAVAPYLESPDFYFSPLKVYEYMAAGRAVVASAIGQLESVISHGQNGLLYSPGNVEQLAATLHSLAKSPGTVERLGRAARQTAVQKHSWERALELILRHVTADHAVDNYKVAL